MRVGILSDTHGLLRPELFARLEGVDHLLHAGDLGPVDLVTELEAIAPLTAVWGNTDGMDVRARLPEIARVSLEGVDVVVMHGHQLPAATPRAAAQAHPGARLIVFGHSHQPAAEWIDGAWIVNPGSAGKRRFTQPVSAAIATIRDGMVREVSLNLW